MARVLTPLHSIFTQCHPPHHPLFIAPTTVPWINIRKIVNMNKCNPISMENLASNKFSVIVTNFYKKENNFLLHLASILSITYSQLTSHPSPSYHLTTSSFQHLTTLPPHHLTISPPYHLTTSPFHHLTTLPPYHLTTSPPHHLTT